MTLPTTIQTINTFTKFNTKSFSGSNQLKAIEAEIGELSPQVAEYIEQIAPDKQNVLFDLTGNPTEVVCAKKMTDTLFNFAYEHGLLGASWVSEWLVVGYQMHNAYCISQSDDDQKVYQFLHSESFRNEPIPVADSIGHFLLCAHAVDFALNEFENAEILHDNPFSITLAPEPAKWLFPKMKTWAGEYYDEWCRVFNNYKEDY